MGTITIGNRTITFASVGDSTVNAIYYGHTLIYVYVGYVLCDSEEYELCDSDGYELTVSE